MFVRWKRRRLRRHQDTAWDAVLVQSVRIAGAPRQRTVRYLGSIRAQYRTAPAHRQAFWAAVEQRLAPLALEPATRQAVNAQLEQQIPRPTAAELHELARQRALFDPSERVSSC
jgi:hypothetical protein